MICPDCGLNCTARMHVCAVRKMCPDCGQEKEPQAFGIHPSSMDGRKNRCLQCQGARDRQIKQDKHTERIESRETRARENALLKAHGYRWRKATDAEDFEYWALYTRSGQPISKDEALLAIQAIEHPAPPRGEVDAVREWARQVVAARPCFLDTETTGFSTSAELIEIAIVDVEGQVLLNTRVRCQEKIPASAARVHGITNELLSRAPTFPEVWNTLAPLLTRPQVIYHAEFDTRILKQTLARYHIQPGGGLRTACLMKAYARYVGERGTQGDVLFQKLDRACHEFGIEPGGHNALGDAQAARLVLLKLASL